MPGFGVGGMPAPRERRSSRTEVDPRNLPQGVVGVGVVKQNSLEKQDFNSSPEENDDEEEVIFSIIFIIITFHDLLVLVDYINNASVSYGCIIFIRPRCHMDSLYS